MRTVVTDDQGRYLVPDLPEATYAVWVRGVNSEKVHVMPGEQLHLTAVPAPNPQAAAQYYPAGDRLSLIEVPGHAEFPDTGPDGNSVSPNVESQAACRVEREGTLVNACAVSQQARKRDTEQGGSLPAAT